MMKTIVIGFTFLLFFYSEALSGSPAPYTEEAYNKIKSEFAAFTKKVKPEEFTDLSNKERQKRVLELSRNAFAKAGYSYDVTIIKVVNDMRHHPERIPNNPNSVPTMIYIDVHMMMSECNYVKVDCLKFFSSDTVAAISWLIKNTEFYF